MPRATTPKATAAKTSDTATSARDFTVTFRVTPEEKAKIDAAVLEQDRKQSEILRRLIRDHL